MSVSTFFEKTKAQIKNAVSAHPIEIFLISAFAIGIWFMELGLIKKMIIWLTGYLSQCYLSLFISLDHILGIVFHGLCHWWR